MKKILFCLLIVLTLAGGVQATTYYVSQTGSDGNTGLSWATAWATVAKVNNELSVGDTVYFGTGIWYDSQINPPHSGTYSTRTVYACSTMSETSKHNPKIYGGTLVTDWIQHSGNIYKAKWVGSGCHENGKCYTLGCDDSLMNPNEDEMPDAEGEFWHDLPNDTIYAWCWGGGDPDNYTMVASCKPAFRTYDLGGLGRRIKHVLLWGLDFRYGKQATVFIHQNADSVFFEHCHISRGSHKWSENGSAVMFWAANYEDTSLYSHFVTFRACSLGHSKQVWTGMWEGDGIIVYCAHHTYVESCYFYGPIATGINFKMKGAGGTTVGNVARFNTIVNPERYGIDVYTHPYKDSLYGNIIIGGRYSSITIRGCSMGTYPGYIFVGNNTMYNIKCRFINGPWGDSCGTGNEIKYNIGHTVNSGECNDDTYTLGFLYSDKGCEDGYTIDSNMWYVTSFSGPCDPPNLGYSWSHWQNSCGFDVNGSNGVDPRFNDPENGDFSRPNASQEMNLTYGGRTWKLYGAWQPSFDDSTAPAAITDLATSNPTSNSITLSWTAPGDDGNTGTASRYDIRYSTSTINQANWPLATQVSGEPTPQIAGTSQSMTISGLNSSTAYYFAMETADEAPNWSGLSNVASGTTSAPVPDTTAPGAITDFSSSNPTSNSITLSWTAPGDDGNTGTASQYDIRYSTNNITEANWSFATQVSDELTPQVAGTSQSMIVSGLSPSTTYYFAIKTADEIPNWSGLSNVVSDTTSDNLALGITPDVDGTYPGYTITPITEGVIDPYGGTATTWASDESSILPHWIIIDFEEDHRVNNVTIYWAWNDYLSQWMTPSEHHIQYWDGSDYLDAATLTDPPIGSVTVTTFSEVTTSRIRVYQPANMGPPYYPTVIWLTELEIYGRSDTVDTTPPTTEGHNPAPDAVDVPIDANIVFHLTDSGEGVDQSSIRVIVEGEDVSSSLDIQGTPSDYTITYDSPVGFSYTQVVDITIAAQDLASPPNVMTTFSYSFTTQAEPDTTAPIIYNVSSSNISSDSATITWDTDEPATSQVEYGLTTSYGYSTTLDPNLVTTHSQNLTGLSSSTLYHYRVRSRDAEGNERISSDYTFTTSAPPDTTPPVISDVQSSGITYNSATVSWDTDEPATSQVEYGLTTSYGYSTTLDPNLVTSHSQNLAGLSSSTLYHYRVRSRDAVGNERISSDYTFTTLAPPDTTPPVISNVQSSGVTHNSATVSWDTDEPATSRVEYGLTLSYGSTTTLDSNLVTRHSQSLSGLSPSTLYHYRVRSRDAVGNERISSDYTFTTLAPPDTTPPVISNVGGSGITRHKATINWDTDEVATSLVEYGLTPSYGLSTDLDTALVTDHSQLLTGLHPHTLYHFRVRSMDAAGNEAMSQDYLFRTAPRPMRPRPINPPDDTTLGVPNPGLVILNGVDSLGFELLHLFQIDTIVTFNSPSMQQSSPFGLEYVNDSTTLWTVPQELVVGTYYWRAYAYTNAFPSDTSDPSQVFSFRMIYTDIMDTVYQLALEYPLPNDTVPTLRPTLVARLVSGSPEMNLLSCQFEVSEYPHFSNNVLSSDRITFFNDGTARWEVTQDLKQNATFYWRAKLYSQDRLLDITQTSTIFTGTIHVFPNPFKPSSGHSHVTFRNIPLNSTIRVTTISGDLVKTFNGVQQTDVVWDVKSEDQKELASGVYLYWVSHGEKVSSGKIFVIR